jgi:hypothetical protein
VGTRLITIILGAALGIAVQAVAAAAIMRRQIREARPQTP